MAGTAARTHRMTWNDTLLGLLVPIIWGLNFVVIRVGLDSITPLMLAALRFGLAAAVGVWFVPRPAVPAKVLVVVGCAIGVGQFGILFTAIDLGMPSGLAGVVVQSQVVFTILLAWLVLSEPPSRSQLIGVAVAASGLALLAVDVAQRLVVVGFVLTLVAGLSWALGNLQVRAAGSSDAMGIVVWSSLVPPVPLVVISLIVDGPEAVTDTVANLTVTSALTIAYQALLATLVGFGVWVRLLARHPAATVAPFALLVPAVALISAAALLDEPVSILIVIGATLVTVGLATTQLLRR